MSIGFRRLLVGAAVLAAVAGFAAFWLRSDESGPGAPITETLERGPIAAVVTATGTVNPVSTVQVGTYVSGPILALDVDFNSPVRKGQRVAKIDPGPFQMKVDGALANVANARARVQKSEADLALKRRQLARQEQLHARDAISEDVLDTSRSARDQAVAQLALDQAAVQQAEATLREARINLGYTEIVSPVDGVVVSRNVDVGQTVAASFQTPTLFLIAQDLTQMQVNANVSESDIGAVREGQAATFTVDAYPGRTFQGRVSQVRNSPVTLQNVVTYPVVVAVGNEDLSLKPGMTATVTILEERRDDALRVPLRALRFSPPESPPPAPGSPPAVWVQEPGGEMRRVEVKTGLRDERFAEVLEGGLAAGDRVVVGLPKADAKPAPSNPFAPRMR